MAAPEESVRLHLYCPSIKPAKSASNWAECVGQHNHKSYTDEALAEYGPNVQRARWCFGDNIELMSCPTVVKSRKIGDPNAILLPLNARRHWGRSTAGLPARGRGRQKQLEQMTEAEKKAEAAWRLEKNRLAARDCRRAKKERLERQEEQLEFLGQENKRLTLENGALTKANRVLQMEKQALIDEKRRLMERLGVCLH